jgi:uncharacterized protein YukE
MADEIKFDFSKAQSLINSIKTCKRSLEDLGSRLLKEVERAGSWWKGDSYTALKEVAGRNKATIGEIAGKSADVSAHVAKVAESKKAWEQNGSKCFK